MKKKINYILLLFFIFFINKNIISAPLCLLENSQEKKEVLKNKNDNSRSYKGTEPSPKGLGFCAHCIPLNVTMKGLDGNLWENQKFTKGKRWVKIRVDMN